MNPLPLEKELIFLFIQQCVTSTQDQHVIMSTISKECLLFIYAVSQGGELALVYSLVAVLYGTIPSLVYKYALGNVLCQHAYVAKCIHEQDILSF